MILESELLFDAGVEDIDILVLAIGAVCRHGDRLRPDIQASDREVTGLGRAKRRSDKSAK